MKLLKKLLLLGCVTALVFVGVIGFLGYHKYKEAVESISITDKVKEIQASPDYVPYEDISQDVLRATVAIEDHRFYSHHGLDYISIARATLTNLFQKDIVGGGSTITQQLAKNMYFGYDTSFVRKVSELFVVHDLESMYSKEEILTLYVNIINYGDQHIGIKQASEGYFGLSPKELSFDQATLLVGIPQSPSNYQLSNHYEQAVQRQYYVHKAMLEQGMIDELHISYP